MNLPSPDDLADWPARVAAATIPEMRGKITIYTPAVYGPRDPETDERTVVTPEAVHVGPSRRARIQPLRAPLDDSTAESWGTKRVVQFQIEILDDDPVLTKGMMIRVDDGGRDKALESFTYEIESAINGSDAAVRTIFTISELAPKGS